MMRAVVIRVGDADDAAGLEHAPQLAERGERVAQVLHQRVREHGVEVASANGSAYTSARAKRTFGQPPLRARARASIATPLASMPIGLARARRPAPGRR